MNTLIQNDMKTNTKESYISPKSETIETTSQNFICQSGGTDQYGTGNTDNWF